MKLILIKLAKVTVWIALAVAFWYLGAFQSELINDPFLNYSLIIIEFVFLSVLAVRAKARIKAREVSSQDLG